MTTPPTRQQILNEAATLTTDDRNKTHGDPYEQLGTTAKLWSVILGKEVTRHQVAQCNVAQKMSRTMHGSYNRDDYRDQAGYSAIAAEVQELDDFFKAGGVIITDPSL